MQPPDPRSGVPALKIALVNVKYSPNLGDGLIAECLEWALCQALPDAAFVSIDLAGRGGFDPDAGSGRGRALAILERFPKPVRQLAISAILRTLIETRYKATWRDQLEGCDRIVLGGGQLMADADLNFPLKIGAIAVLARVIGIPSAVFGVGVSKDWSVRGAQMFEAAMADLRPSYIALRDEASVINWTRHFASTALPHARLCRDPGLLAGEVYTASPRPARQRPLIGLGVVHPLTLNLHSQGPPLSKSLALELWTSVARALVARDLDVALFTNGPSDDEAFAREILQAAGQLAPGRITLLPKPKLPADLVTNIAGCDAITAHRLHASIVSFALKIPHVGLGWDAKLPAFFASVGRSAYVGDDIRSISPGGIAQLVAKALADPVPESTYSTAVAEAWAGIRGCAGALTTV